jgi:hypothetical protein
MSDEAENIAAEEARLKVSPYDRASSWLIALLISVGLVATVLLALWLTARPPREYGKAGPVPAPWPPIEGEGGSNGKPAGGGAIDELPDAPLPMPSATTLGAISEIQELLSDPAIVEQLPDPEKIRKETGIPGLPGRPGTGPDKRAGKPGRPRHWEVIFAKGATVDGYAKQLDLFRIELGVIKESKIYYASNFQKRKPDTRVEENPSENERRYWLRWIQGDLKKADEELLAKAGIESPYPFILKFLPAELEAKLVELERAHAGDKVDQIKKTRFGIKQVGGGYEFYVIDQTYKE